MDTSCDQLLSALESQLESLKEEQRSIDVYKRELHNSDDLQATQLLASKLQTAIAETRDDLVRFAATGRELREVLRIEIQSLNASALIDGLSSILPADELPASVSQVEACINQFHRVFEQLKTARASLNEYQGQLITSLAEVEALLVDIVGLGGEAGALLERSVRLKASVQNVHKQQIELLLEEAKKLEGEANFFRNQLQQSWHHKLQHVYQDNKRLLDQSREQRTTFSISGELERTLEEADTFINAMLTPATPLHFEPTRMIACYEALCTSSVSIRRELMTVQPQMAVEALRDLSARLNSERAHTAPLSPEELREAGTAIVSAASVPAGYSGFVWEIGFTVLMQLVQHDYRAADEFYQQYGYSAVATALAASLSGGGDFPLGLSFAEHQFYLADIESVLRHPLVLEALRHTCTTRKLPPISVECFARVSPDLRRATLVFLGIAPDIQLPESLFLQISAALLAVATSPEEQPRAGQIFIRALLHQEQCFSAYGAWHALALEQQHLQVNDPIGMEALYSLLWRLCLNGHNSGANQLVALCTDTTLQDFADAWPCIALALSLGCLHLARVSHPLGEELAPLFLEMLGKFHNYPAISHALRLQMPVEPDESLQVDTELAAMQDLQKEYSLKLEEIEGGMHAHYSYGPAEKMHDQITHEFRPWLISLKQGSELEGKLVGKLLDANLSERDISTLARKLVDEAESSRREKGKGTPPRVEGNNRQKLQNNIESLLRALAQAIAMRDSLAVIQSEQRKTKQQSWKEAELAPDQLEEELERLLKEVPQARRLLQFLLPDISLTGQGAVTWQ